MRPLRRYWRRLPAALRKPLVFLSGVIVVLAGLAMLVLPGPGWVAIFLGFAILATEFTVAEQVRDWLLGKLKALFGLIKRLIGK